jgi:TPR repeat protein
MIEDFPDLLKRAVAGDESAIELLLHYFQDQSITATEQESAHAYLKQAARQNHHAIYLRGLLYEYGYGVKQDLDMSFLLMREAASKGNEKATYEVGKHFLEGMGVEKNYENAFQWLKIAAGGPYYIRDAMYSLAQMYEQGWGVDPDPAKALEWYEKAAQKGHQGAKGKISPQ